MTESLILSLTEFCAESIESMAPVMTLKYLWPSFTVSVELSLVLEQRKNLSLRLFIPHSVSFVLNR